MCSEHDYILPLCYTFMNKTQIWIIVDPIRLGRDIHPYCGVSSKNWDWNRVEVGGINHIFICIYVVSVWC